MRIVLRKQGEVPIYAQIEEQIREQILSGELVEGEVLPSIRKLAKEVGVSVITTTRAYNDLEAEGFITSVQGKGSIVRSRDNGLLRERVLVRIEESLEQAISGARRIGLSREELLEMIDNLWEVE